MKKSTVKGDFHLNYCPADCHIFPDPHLRYPAALTFLDTYQQTHTYMLAPAIMREQGSPELLMDAAILKRKLIVKMHLVPLSTQALAILKQIKQFCGAYDLIFIGEHDSHKPMSENTVNSALRVMGYDTKV